MNITNNTYIRMQRDKGDDSVIDAIAWLSKFTSKKDELLRYINVRHDDHVIELAATNRGQLAVISFYVEDITTFPDGIYMPHVKAGEITLMRVDIATEYPDYRQIMSRNRDSGQKLISLVDAYHRPDISTTKICNVLHDRFVQKAIDFQQFHKAITGFKYADSVDVYLSGEQDKPRLYLCSAINGIAFTFIMAMLNR